MGDEYIVTEYISSQTNNYETDVIYIIEEISATTTATNTSIRKNEKILKFPISKEQYFFELQMYSDLEFSKHIPNLDASQININDINYPAIIIKKINPILLKPASNIHVEQQTENYHQIINISKQKLLIKNLFELFKNLMQTNYVILTEISSNFGWDEDEQIFKVFNIGKSFQIPNTEKEYKILKNKFKQHSYFS